MSEGFLPYGRQTIEDDDVQAVAEALRSDFLTTGPRVAEFETRFAETVGAGHAVAASNGTATLHLSMMALDVGPGDVCIAPSITFLATANCAVYVGADVVFADVDPDSGLMTPETLAEALDRAKGRRVRAVLPVHPARRGLQPAGAQGPRRRGRRGAGRGRAACAGIAHAVQRAMRARSATAVMAPWPASRSIR